MARQIGEEHERSLEDADQHGTVGIAVQRVHLGGQIRNPLLNFRFRDQYFFNIIQ